jgi:hypothetical protein
MKAPGQRASGAKKKYDLLRTKSERVLEVIAKGGIPAIPRR